MPRTEDRKTPGVYATELQAFPTSVVGVQTAVPIFVGYTETAETPMRAVRIGSMAEYAEMFGGAARAKFALTASDASSYDIQAGAGYYSVKPAATPPYNLYMALELFYANGGGACYVVSTGGYEGAITREALLDGIAVAGGTAGPAMLVVPDACRLTGEGDYGAVATAALNQASTLRDRVAILDLPGAMNEAEWTKSGLAAQRDRFYEAVAPAASGFSYGAAYAPALRTSVLSAADADYTNLQATQESSDLLKSLLVAEASTLYGADTSGTRQILAKLDQAFPADIATGGLPPSDVVAVNNFLTNALPLLQQIEAIVVAALNVAPPSGAMAGIWASNDTLYGVWNAPANRTLACVVAPEVQLDDSGQGNYTVPTNGNAVNLLRGFVNRGTVVWGARTLDGNSDDYRYIQVRRTLVYIEQSIKTALQPFVFAANDGQTWVAVTAMISSFLQAVWAQGGLMGASASDAYTVQCGLGATMTATDILNGYMIVNVTLQMVHPAEFIELTFRQKMQGAG